MNEISNGKRIEIDDGDCQAIIIEVFGKNISIETTLYDHILLYVDQASIHFLEARWAEMDGEKYSVGEVEE